MWWLDKRGRGRKRINATLMVPQPHSSHPRLLLLLLLLLP